ncbi:DNA polymerase zeta catalytic subunit [Erysiphe neolycopersici]|uniref:DNA polymerase n=1 Tax=Erysiphe neolycopersici TaxID=212602 RepID=A0A420I5J7_9PEZI|nr:DNA polymerase zeta catalytic subunit [Erysiphe neolycopersici]
MEIFRVRLNCIDHYQTPPSKFDPQLRRPVKSSDSHNEPKVPVIRVFGATQTGQKVCAHIHGAFPYLYIEYQGGLLPNDVSKYIQLCHTSIDNALAVSYRRNVNDHNSKYVARITLVKGIPFYGFHVGYKLFLKIYMLDPMVMTHLADVLRQGAIMNKVFQPYEAHLQYYLQWMTDFNIYGSNYIKCSRISFRAPVPKYVELDKKSHLWHDHSISPDWITSEETLGRNSYCSIEVDIQVQDILNRRETKPRHLHHDFIERLGSTIPQEKLVHSLAELWKDETKRRKARMTNADPSSSPFPPEVMVSMSADPRYSQAGGWIHEEDYNQKLDSLINEEKSNSNGTEVTFESFLSPIPLEAIVKTTQEAVEDLFPINLRPILGLTPPKPRDSVRGGDKIKVAKKNESLIMNENLNRGFLNRKYQNDFTFENPITDLTPSLSYMSNFSFNNGKNLSGIESLFESPKIISKVDVEIENSTVKEPNDINLHTNIHNDINDFPRVNKISSRNLKRSRSQTLLSSSRKRQSVLFTHSINGNDHVNSDIFNVMNKQSIKIGKSNSTHGSQVSKESQYENRLVSKVSFLSQSRKPTSVKDKSQDKKLHFPVVKGSRHFKIFNKDQSQKDDCTSILIEKENKSSPVLKQSPARIQSNKYPPSELVSPNFRTPPTTISLLLKNINKTFSETPRKIFVFHNLPPSTSSVISTMHRYNIPSFAYQNAFYSNELDVPERTREWAGREFKLDSLSVTFLPEFSPLGIWDQRFKGTEDSISYRLNREDLYNQWRRLCGLRSWSIAEPPPSRKQVCDWLHVGKIKMQGSKIQHSFSLKRLTTPPKKLILSQIEGSTQKNKFGCKYTQGQKSSNMGHDSHDMSIMSLELHINTRDGLSPNPETDEIKCLFWCFKSDDNYLESINPSTNIRVGIVVLSECWEISERIRKQASVEVCSESTELDLLIRIVDIVRNYDPDILTGYEVQSSSWGYLIERARLKYDYNLCGEFSRIKYQTYSSFDTKSDQWGLQKTSTIHVTGRHVINIWRAMRSELNLLQYTIENVAFHLLHRRIPHFTWTNLTHWFMDNKPKSLAIVVNYYISRVQLNIEILERNEFIERTSEQARLLGVDFFSVISRGSQYKVESLMFRIAKPENFLLVSPSRKQVGSQNALECLPLVMEPQSAFYNSPLLVLDFQSLYPSLIIAYNYCYSTFLGRIVNWCGKSKMGFTEYQRQHRLLELLRDYINISPNGMMYVKHTIRKSLLAKMLGEILETRLMVKSGMKLDKDDKALQRLLNNRQLALKLISNVTYGYTSASFSGRMPCSEIADSIVQTGRETLEKAIALIHSVKKWNAEVVYGDTDSLFVYLRGRTKDQAFDIGSEIAKTITDLNPRPIKLKFEKVYLPCVLIAKKRYVGFKYEYRDQLEPEFDAKGIETVRRDGTPAEQKIQEKALKIFFRTSDLSQVKNYFQSQCEKIMKGSVSIQDFCFAKEVRLGTYSDRGQPPPGALISTKRMAEDIRSEPQYGERVPYVVITGAPKARLIDRCVAPEELLENSHNQLDSEYYISKNIIPPLERIFNLVGANVRGWYDDMQKFQRVRRVDFSDEQSKESAATKIIESYMKSSTCLVCWKKLEVEGSICRQCKTDLPRTLLLLRQKLNKVESKYLDILNVCQSCSGTSPLEEVRCDSKDCPVFYTRKRQEALLKSEKSIIEPLMKDLLREIVNEKDLDW